MAAVGVLSIGSAEAATAATAPAACQANQLNVTVGQIDAGAGQRYAPLRLTTNGAPCTLTGYVTDARFIARDGSALPTKASKAPDTVTPTTLSAGHGATVTLHWSGVPADDESVDQAPPAYLTFRVPGGSHDLTVRWPDSPTYQHGQLDFGAFH